MGSPYERVRRAGIHISPSSLYQRYEIDTKASKVTGFQDQSVSLETRISGRSRIASRQLTKVFRHH